MNDFEKYQTNESLLQSYRSIFISSESFLLGVGAIFLEKNLIMLIITAVISLLIIWFFWFPIVRSRHLIVDYYKYRANMTSASSDICSVDDYVNRKNIELRKKTNKILGITTNWRKTRKKVDLYIPILFSIVWVSLVVVGLFNR